MNPRRSCLFARASWPAAVAPSPRRVRPRGRAGPPDGDAHGPRPAAGAPLPGVVVTAKAPTLQGEPHDRHVGERRLRVQQPPARRYTSRSRSRPSRRDGDVPLRGLARRSRSTRSMGVARRLRADGGRRPDRDDLDVEPGLGDVHGGQLDNLPTARTLLSAVTLSPGRQPERPERRLHDLGRAVLRQPLQVDGAVINDNIRGTPYNLFIEDAIQETTTSSSAISAEFGRFTGGVVNTITKSGGNTFSGSFRTTFTNDAWSATTPVERGPRPERRPARTRRRSAGRSGRTGCGSSARAGSRTRRRATRPRSRTSRIRRRTTRSARRQAHALAVPEPHAHGLVHGDQAGPRERLLHVAPDPRPRQPQDPEPPAGLPRPELHRRPRREPLGGGAVLAAALHVRERRLALHGPREGHGPHRRVDGRLLQLAVLLRRLQQREARQPALLREGHAVPLDGVPRLAQHRRRLRQLHGQGGPEQLPVREQLRRRVDGGIQKNGDLYPVFDSSSYIVYFPITQQTPGSDVQDARDLPERPVAAQDRLLVQPRRALGQERGQGRRRRHARGRQLASARASARRGT